MVLSNKKLKQKIRAELAKSLVATEAQTHQQATDDATTTTTQTHHHQSLKSLLDSAAQKPRLSKREIKRLKTFPLQETTEDAIGEGGSNGVDEGKKVKILVGEDGSKGADEGQKREKKRKRENKDEDGEGTGGKILEQKKSNKKKKNKKKYKKKNKKGGKGDNVEEEKKGVGIVQSAIEEQSVPETIEANDSKEKEDISTKVYVGGIPYYSTEDDIWSYFEGCGTITEIDCLYFPETGKFKGIAMISFQTEAAAKRALALDGSDMGGLFLKIQPYKASKVTKVSDFAPAILEGYNRIYIGNLSWDITEDEIKKLFSDCNISSIRLGKDKETGDFRGYAHVDFADSLSLNIALKLDQQMVSGRPVKIRCAVPPKVVKTNSTPMLTNRKAEDSKLVSSSKKAEDVAPVPSSKKAEDAKSVPSAKVDAEENAVSDISGKIKRRTCYECGKKGHLSSACPTSKKAEESIPMSSSNKAEDMMPVPAFIKADDIKSKPATNKDIENNLVNSSLTGKIRRRTCYECGEKGHLSSACPKTLASDPTNASDMIPVASTKDVDDTKSHGNPLLAFPNKLAFYPTRTSDLMPVASSKDTDDTKSGPPAKVDTEDIVVTAVSGKIRRRTCYECGEKGHLSSACPMKLASDQTKFGAT